MDNLIARYTWDDNLGGPWIEPEQPSSTSQENDEKPCNPSSEVVEDKPQSSTVESLDKTWTEIFQEQVDRDNGTFGAAVPTYANPGPDPSSLNFEYTSSDEWIPSYENRGDGWGILAEKATSYVVGLKNLFWEYPAEAANPEKEKVVIKNDLVADQIKEKVIAQLNESEEASESTECPTQQKVIIIPGGTGHLGREYTEKAIKEGYNVIITSRDISDYQKLENKNLHYVQASIADQSNPEFWKQLMGKYSDAESVTLVNAVGSPEAPKGKTLRDVNVVPAAAMAKGMKELEDSGVLKDARFVQLSSMGAIMLENDPYGSSKKEAEELIKADGPKNTCIIRVGYAFQNAVKGKINKIDNTHAYSPEQLAALPIQPILGNGQQLLQPVFTGDIVDAGLNFKKGVKVINAIGPEVLTQDNFVGYFCELKGKKFRPVHIDVNLADTIVKSFPKGHFSGYAVEGCRKLENNDMIYDPKEFEEVVGHKLSRLNDVYGDLKGEKLFYPRPPIGDHLKESITKLYNNESNARENLKEAISTIVKKVLGNRQCLQIAQQNGQEE